MCHPGGKQELIARAATVFFPLMDNLACRSL
jgi:hypothetical protein